MKDQKTFVNGVMVGGLMLMLSACGGSSSNDRRADDEASGSDSFISKVSALVDTSPEEQDAEPVDGITPTTPENTEPLAF